MQLSTPSNSAAPEVTACGANLENNALRVVMLKGIDPSAEEIFHQTVLAQAVAIAHKPKGINSAVAPDFLEGREDPEQSAELERQQDV